MTGHRGRPPLPPEIAAKILELRRAGFGYKKIAARLDIGRSTVRRYVRRLSHSDGGLYSSQGAGRIAGGGT